MAELDGYPLPIDLILLSQVVSYNSAINACANGHAWSVALTFFGSQKTKRHGWSVYLMFTFFWGGMVGQLTSSCDVYLYIYMDVSKNRGYPKMDDLQWKSLLKWMIWGVFPYFWKHPYIYIYIYQHHPKLWCICTLSHPFSSPWKVPALSILY